MECADDTCRKASAVSSGKPTTTPSATTPSEGTSRHAGRGWRSASSSASPSSAAMLARAQVRKMGSKSMTATRVAGSEPAKIATPMKPLTHPPADLSMAAPLLLTLQWSMARAGCPGTMQYGLKKLLFEIIQYS